MKAIEQYFYVVLNGLVCCTKWPLICNSVDQTPLCDHSTESCLVALLAALLTALFSMLYKVAYGHSLPIKP